MKPICQYFPLCFCIWCQAWKALFHPKIIKIFCDYSMQRNWKEFLPIKKEFGIEGSRNTERCMNVMRMAVQVTTVLAVPMTVPWSIPTMSWTEVIRLFSVVASCPQGGGQHCQTRGKPTRMARQGFSFWSEEREAPLVVKLQGSEPGVGSSYAPS